LIENERTILVNWYNSLTSKDLVWNFGLDLCGQTGVTCIAQSVTEL